MAVSRESIKDPIALLCIHHFCFLFFLYFFSLIHRYLRALGAFYLRLVGKPVDIYKYLESLLADSRKLRKRSAGKKKRLFTYLCFSCCPLSFS